MPRAGHSPLNGPLDRLRVDSQGRALTTNQGVQVSDNQNSLKAGAHGYFEGHESLADVTEADLFSRTGNRTPVFVRFSTVAGERGSADTARDVRGFAVKFYTAAGNWDLVGNNMPVSRWR